MTKITIDEVKKLAKLSAISLSEAEEKDFQSELEKILHYVDKLQNIDTEGIALTTQVNDLKNVYRVDETEQQLPQVELLKNAPQQQNGYLKVPRVL